jgi:DNA-binding transcriptional MerR regulator
MIRRVPAELTIEQLAAESGMTVRNIRAHQARGLITPPVVRMRIGYYGPRHLAALRLIRELQDDGFNLAAIQRLLSDRERTEQRLARFRSSLPELADAEPPQRFTAGQLRARFALSEDETDQVLAHAQRLGLLVADGKDRFVAPRPSLLDVGQEVVARGISLSRALAAYEDAEREFDALSGSFVRLFVADVWRGFERDGMPEERWPELRESIERLAALAADAVAAGFSERLRTRIDQAFDAARRTDAGLVSRQG